jgi:hypothetical protein
MELPRRLIVFGLMSGAGCHRLPALLSLSVEENMTGAQRSRKWYYANLEKARERAKLLARRLRAENPEKYRKIGTASWRKRTEFNRALVADYKRILHCADCGESDPVVIDFHHKDPSTKLFRIGIAAYRKGPEEIILEILKCIALCANCHRRRHYS